MSFSFPTFTQEQLSKLYSKLGITAVILVVCILASLVVRMVVVARISQSDDALSQLSSQDVRRENISIQLPQFGTLGIAQIENDSESNNAPAITVPELTTLPPTDNEPEYSITTEEKEFTLGQRTYADIKAHVVLSINGHESANGMYLPGFTQDLASKKVTRLMISGTVNGIETQIPFYTRKAQIANNGQTVLGNAVLAEIPANLMRDDARITITYDIVGANALDFRSGGFPVRLQTMWNDIAFRQVDITSNEPHNYAFTVGSYAKPQSFSRASSSSFDYVYDNEPLGTVTFLTKTGDIVKVDRATKFATIIIVLTFAALFFIDMKKRYVANIFQYALVGISLALFYLLVLSVGEHIGFTMAYFAATLVTMIINGWYCSQVFASRKTGTTVALVLGVLYALMYGLLALTKINFIVGVVMLYVVLMIFMFATARMNRQS